MAALTEIEVQHTTSHVLNAHIADNGDFVLTGQETYEAQDIGDPTGRYAGERSYMRTVPAQYKDTVLLWLIREQFQSDADFDSWLDGKGIPSEFRNVD